MCEKEEDEGGKQADVTFTAPSAGGSQTGVNMETGLPSGTASNGELQFDVGPYPSYPPEHFPDGP